MAFAAAGQVAALTALMTPNICNQPSLAPPHTSPAPPAVIVNQFGGTRTKFVTGQPVLVYFSIADEQPLPNIASVWAFTAAAVLVAWAGLHVRCHYWRR